MSIWAEISGHVDMPIGCHFSVAKSLREHFPETNKPFVRSVYGPTGIRLTFSVSICDEGMSAAKTVDSWFEKLPKGSEIEARIRWIK